MIKRSLILTIVLLTLFEIFLRVSNFNLDTSQNDKSENLISAQNYIYNFSDEQIERDTLIIGSSISRKIITDSLGKHFLNLSFNGWSSYDGLELVNLTKKKPSCLLIETNVVRDEVLQQELLNCLNPVSYYSNKMFKSLQLQNQPVGLIIGYCKEIMKDRIEELKKKKRENLALYKFTVQMQKEKMKNADPNSAFTIKFKALKNLIDSLKKQDISIVFFEVPIDKDLEKWTSITRKYFYQYFPDNEYTYVRQPLVNDFIYSDGIHLSSKSALEYTLYLKEELNTIKNRN